VALYFFDTRDNDAVVADDVGLELPHIDAVKVQAAKSLAELALDVLPGSLRRSLRVDVRDAEGQPVLITELIFEARILIPLAG
jgi:hypothetical protein